MAIKEKYKIDDFSLLLRIGGVGYRTRLSKNLKSSKWKRFRLLFDKARLPLEVLLGNGRPLNPYLLGIVKRFLLEKMAPKELKTPPLELFEFEGMSDFLEYSLLRNWVESYLNYLKWYCGVLMDPYASLETILSGPVIETHWSLRREDKILSRWGLIWRVYDMVQRLGLDHIGGVLGVPTQSETAVMCSTLQHSQESTSS